MKELPLDLRSLLCTKQRMVPIERRDMALVIKIITNNCCFFFRSRISSPEAMKKKNEKKRVQLNKFTIYATTNFPCDF